MLAQAGMYGFNKIAGRVENRMAYRIPCPAIRTPPISGATAIGMRLRKNWTVTPTAHLSFGNAPPMTARIAGDAIAAATHKISNDSDGESSFPLRLRRGFGLHARSGAQLIRAAQGDLVAGSQFAEDFYEISSLMIV
jgi:hypothetical protein